MALISRRRHIEEEAESVFVSMTDLMISILFIVMIVMAFFAKYAQEEENTEVKTLKAQIERLTNENEDLRSELLKLQNDLAIRINQEDRIIALRDDNGRLRKELAELDVQNKDLTAKIEKLELRLKDLEAENAKLKSDNTELTSINKKLDTENSRLTTENTELQNEIDRLNQIIKSQQEELERLREIVQNTSPLENVLRGIADDKRVLLDVVGQRLEDAGIKVSVDQVSGVIRFQEDAIQFASNQSVPTNRSKANLLKIADVLTAELECFTLQADVAIDTSCNPNASIIEAVQIEGHTDAQGDQKDNLPLSTARATSTYGIMAEHQPELERYLNANFILSDEMIDSTPGQQVLSVSGYGESRLIDRQGPEANAVNRRIDIRIIMTTPKTIEEVNKLKSAVINAVETRRDQ